VEFLLPLNSLRFYYFFASCIHASQKRAQMSGEQAQRRRRDASLNKRFKWLEVEKENNGKYEALCINFFCGKK